MYTQKCRYNLLGILKRKKKLQHLKLGKLKLGIHKIGCSMSWTRYMLRIRNAKYFAKHTWNFIDTSVSIEHLWFSHNQNECCNKMVHMNENLTNRYIFFKKTGTKRSLHNMALWTILENSLWILQKGVSKCLNSIFWWLVLESWVSNFKTLSGFFPMVSGNFQKHEAIFFKIDFSRFA